MRYIDLFAGVGGFRYGIEKAFYDKYPEGIQQGAAIENSPDTRESFLASEPLCVFSNEWDKYANSVYKKHWGECDDRDIRTITAEEIPDHDLLVGGFPCQSFSIAGKRGGFEDTRGTLFFEIARIVKQKQPRLLLLENVKGLLSHDKGKTFETIISTLDELGYDCQWQVLNSKNFGVPQNRERVFIVGHLRGTSRPEVFPRNTSNPQRWYGFREVKSGLAPTIPARAREDGSGQPVVAEGLSIRRLTPVECERLQGFPDTWTEGVSETQRYKCLGNAVTVNVIENIFAKIFT